MAKALSLVAYDDLESQVEALERDGYVYFPSVLDADEIAELRAMMDQLAAIPESHDRDETLQKGDASILAQANPRQRRLLGDHRPSNYD